MHLGCVLLLALVPALRWWPMVSSTDMPLSDEIPYFAAFERVAAGESPYDGSDYLYTPVFAFAGAWSMENLGHDATVALLRGINFLGLAMTIWCALAWFRWTLVQRLVVGSAVMLMAPQVSYSVLFGNLSLAVCGLILSGLVLAPRRPLLAGLLLGVSIVLKPIAPLAVGCLFLRPARAGGRRQMVAGAVAAVVVAVLILIFPYRDGFFDLLSTDRVSRTVSLHRFPKLLGFDISILWVSLPIALAAAALVLRGGLGRSRFLCLALTASVASTPVVWSHTLLLLLPVQALALAVVLDRWRTRRADDAHRLPRWVEPALVLLAVAGLQFASGAGGIDDQGLLLQAVGTAIPALAPFVLLGYVLHHTESF
ncbi:MAG: glycosyltransferase 87 family protein [Acidobacteria bacterium]|nr:glycosyltransferase 87 family protein [Acidobacteriota bacterium]